MIISFMRQLCLFYFSSLRSGLRGGLLVSTPHRPVYSRRGGQDRLGHLDGRLKDWMTVEELQSSGLSRSARISMLALLLTTDD